MSSQYRRFRGTWCIFSLSALVMALTLVPLASLKTNPTPLPGTHGGSAVRPWQVMGPISYKNLTLFPVRAIGPVAATDAYITLDEGIRRGTVVITERGAGGEIARRRRNGRITNQQVSMNTSGDGASVNELSLTNKSGKKLLLLSGELIVGGKQDRIVEEDRIVPPVNVPISLNVFCVEHGRWSQRASASSVERRSVSSPTISSPSSGGSNGSANFSSMGAISHPKLRAAAQDQKAQGKVWEEVSSNNAKLGTANSTDTYQEVYKDKKVEQRIENYVGALEKEVLGPNVVGVIVARNGELVWVDCFANATLFARYWPKLLKSYVVDAMSDQTSEKVPSIDQARAYLYDRAGASSVAGVDGIYRLTKIEQSRFAIFNLEDVSMSRPFVVHFNKMQR